MSRKLTTYRQPPVADLLAGAASIDALAAMRREILAAVATGELQADDKTLRRWAEAVWVRVVELMRAEPRQAPYVYNVTLTWPKPAALAAQLEVTVQAVTAPVAAPAVTDRAASKPGESIREGVAGETTFEKKVYHVG